LRKEIKPPVICEHCGTQLKIGVDARFCDYCKKKYSEDIQIEVTVFWKNRGSCNADRQEFCSMDCARKWLLEFPYNKEEIQFIDLPYISNFPDLFTFLGVETVEVC